MGVLIPVRTFSPDKVAGLLKPIIYCVPYGNIAEDAVSINLLLAEKLIKFKEERRAMRLEQCFNQVLMDLPDGVVIKDFDVMFHPKYQVDVLKIMVMACKKKPFSVIWSGKYEDGRLSYAEEGYPDYKTFTVDEYDVTCII